MEGPIKILLKEHEIILKVVDALESEISQLENKQIDTVFFKNVINFIRNYADKFHHAKEEDILFKEFNKSAEEGCTHCNPVEQMIYEHNQGRDFVKMMEIGLNKKDKTKIIEGAKGYVHLIRDHIFKEDNILYPMADEAINSKRQKIIIVKFKEAEKKRFTKGTKEKYIELANEMEKR